MPGAKNTSSAAASKAKSNSDEDVPRDVRPYDILCGRSKTCFNNIGNRRFRITISMNLKKYDTLANRSEKSKFIFHLSKTLKEDVGFRFVHISSKRGRVELTDEQIRAKIGHALRDLSKAQKEAAALEARPLGTEEAQKIIESSKSPVPTETPAAKIKMVTPDPPARRVTNDFETDCNGKLMALPSCPDIRKEAMMAAIPEAPSQQHVPNEIFFSPAQQQDMLSIADQASKLKIAPPSNQDYADCKPAAIAASAAHCNSAVHVDEDDYCLMPLRFDQPESHGMLDPIPLDVLPAGFVDLKMAPKSRSLSMPNIVCKEAPFGLDDDLSICSVPYNDEVPHHQASSYGHGVFHPRKTRASFPSIRHPQQSHHHDLMSMGSNDDDHMVSLCDSVDCLSLDLDEGVHAA